MQIDHEAINRRGWHQGSVFTVVDSTQILAESDWRPRPPEIGLAPETRLIVASHSCDVVSRHPHELQVEVCPALPLPIGETLAMYGHARDPRRLRLPILLEGRPSLHELHAPLSFNIQRSKLEKLNPDPQAEMAERDIDEYSYWLALRVRRRAFPDAFDKRLSTDNHKRIRKILGRSGVTEHVEALLYSLSSNKELPDSTPYHIKVMLLVNAFSMTDTAVVAELETAKDDIADVLSGRHGIVLVDIALVTDKQITVAQHRSFSNWGFEDISFEKDVDLPSGH